MLTSDGACYVVGDDHCSIAEVALSDQDIEMEDGTLRFGVEKARINWGTFLQDMMRSRGSASSQFKNYSGRGPTVVAQNANGETRVLEGTKTVKEARDRAQAIEEDFKTLNAAEWCERYDVPVSFLSG
jgi:hypothetical protein